MRYYEIVRAILDEAKTRRLKQPLVPIHSGSRRLGYPTASTAVDISRFPIGGLIDADADGLVDQASSGAMRVRKRL